MRCPYSIPVLLAALIVACASLPPLGAYTLSGTVTDLSQKPIPFAHVVATNQVDVSGSSGVIRGPYYGATGWTQSSVEVKVDGAISSAWVDFSSTPQTYPRRPLPITLYLKAPDGTQFSPGDLSGLRGQSRRGTWTLLIGNNDYDRGGSCTWTLHLTSEISDSTTSEGKYVMMGAHSAVDGQGGLYRMRISRPGFTFDPATTEVTVSGNASVDFTGDGGSPGEVITGTVSNAAGALLKGVRVEANCTLSRSGTLWISAGMPGRASIEFEFQSSMPVSAITVPSGIAPDVSILGSNISATVVAPDGSSAPWWDVRGLLGKPARGKWRLDFTNDFPPCGATLTPTLNLIGLSTAYTNGEGNYLIDGVYPRSNDEGGTYKVTPRASGYGFAPDSLDVTIDGSVSGVDFVGRAAPLQNDGDLAGLGDINGDDRLTLQDVVLLLRTVLGTRAPEPGDVAAGDLSGDGILTVADVIQLLQKICFPASGDVVTPA